MKNLDFKDLASILEFRAKASPNQIAYRFIKSRNLKESISITYLDLFNKVLILSNALTKNTKIGDRVLIQHLPSLEYIICFFACIYSGRIAVPIYPPRFNSKLERVIHICKDCSPTAAFINSSIEQILGNTLNSTLEFNNIQWMITDKILNESVQETSISSLHSNTIKPDDIAFLQYTSGSTSDPKGVMLTHANLLANMKGISSKFSMTTNDVGVIWLPPFHDMGLIGGILTPLYIGFPTILFSPFLFLQKPLLWLEAISYYKGTISGGPNFAFEECIKRIKEKDLLNVDLSSWKVAFCGAEPIHSSTLDNFYYKFRKIGFQKKMFYPCYGLAESTLIVTGGEVKEDLQVFYFDKKKIEMTNKTTLINTTNPDISIKNQAKDFISCGTPLEKHIIKIIHPENFEECTPLEIGEIWVSGESVAQGYWQKEEINNEIFNGKVAKKDDNKTYLRTGDLGFIYKNELFVTGRLKDLLIIRGKNFYPQDLEYTTSCSHPSLKRGFTVAFSIENNKVENLIIVQEFIKVSLKPIELEELYSQVINDIKSSIFEEYGLTPFEVLIVPSGTLPLTSSGKIMRQLSKKMYINKQLEAITI